MRHFFSVDDDVFCKSTFGRRANCLVHKETEEEQITSKIPYHTEIQIKTCLKNTQHKGDIH